MTQVNRRQPAGIGRVKNPGLWDIVWHAGAPLARHVGPKVSSKTTIGEGCADGRVEKSGYLIVEAAVPSMASTTWTETGVVTIGSSASALTLSARATGQAVAFSTSTTINLVMWGVVDVVITGVVPAGVVRYVARRNGSDHRIWLNGRFYGSASATNTPVAVGSVLPSIGSWAGSGAHLGGAPLPADTGVAMVARSPRALSDSACIRLSGNPWAIFSGEPDDVAVRAAGGGANWLTSGYWRNRNYGAE